MNNKKEKIIKMCSWILVILWMGLIFKLSSQVASESNSLSSGVTEIVYSTVSKVFPNGELEIDGFNHIVRKNAHFIAYLILGVFLINAFRRSGKKSMKYVVMSFGLCVLYATSDEIHQSFVPGRGPAAFDVLIDSAGAFVGISLYMLIRKVKLDIFKNTKH